MNGRASSDRPPERYEVAVSPLGPRRGRRPPWAVAVLATVAALGLLVVGGHLPGPTTSPAPSRPPTADRSPIATADAPTASPDVARCHSRLDQPDVYGIQPVGLAVDGGVPVAGSAEATGGAPSGGAPQWAWPTGPTVRVPAGAALTIVTPEGACVGTVTVVGPSGLADVSAPPDPAPDGVPLLVAPPEVERTEPLVVRFGVDDASVAYAWTLLLEPRRTPVVTLASVATGESLAASIGFCTLERSWRNGLTERRVCAGAYDPRQVRQILHTSVGDTVRVAPDDPWTARYVGVACFAAPPGVTANGAAVSLSTGPMLTDACATADHVLTPLKAGTYLAYVTVDAVLDGNQVYGDWMLLIEVR